MTDSALRDEVRRIAGDAAMTPADAARWRVHGFAPRVAVAPDSADGVAALLSRASAEGWPVELAGAGTWLDHGAAPAAPPDLLISTIRMTGRIEAEPADLVVGVAAGVPVAALAERLAIDSQELPLDPPALSGATTGALVALGAAGPLRAGLGTPRDYMLGLEVVTGDGRCLSFGGRVVKNVAGYDLVRLLTGSRGTLGLITSAWLRLRARPASDRTLACAGDLDELLEVIAGLADTGVAAAELLAPATARAIIGTSGWTLLLRVRGGRAEVEDAAGRIAGLVAGPQLTESGPDVWTRLAALEAAAAPLFRASRLRADLPTTLAAASQLITRSSNELDDWHVAVHALDGIVRLWPAMTLDDTAVVRLGAEATALRAELEAADGSLLIEAAPVALQRHVPVRGTPDPVVARLEAELKRTFDPAGILGRNREQE